MSMLLASAVLVFLMWCLTHFRWLEEVGGDLLTTPTVAVGFIMLIAYMGGKITGRWKLPRITGYLVVGILVGPYVFDFVTHTMTRELNLINGMALSLIALVAGGELRLRELRPVWKRIVAIALSHVVLLWLIFILAVFLLRLWFPFLAGASAATALVVGMVLGTIAVASSPAVAVAVIMECRSRGPVTNAVLSVTVLKDVVVISLFSLVIALGRVVVAPEASFNLALLAHASFEMLASLGAGCVVGWGMSLYLRYVNRENALFVLGMCLVVAEAGVVFHLEPALVMLAAGILLENVYPERGDRLVHAIEKGSLPVYTLFFCLAGAVLNLDALSEMWLVACGLVVVRLVGLYGATWCGNRVVGASPDLERLGWMGFIAQAGVSVGLAAMLLRGFPELGSTLQTLILAMIAINQLLGPIGFRYALVRTGEARAT